MIEGSSTIMVEAFRSFFSRCTTGNWLTIVFIIHIRTYKSVYCLPRPVKKCKNFYFSRSKGILTINFGMTLQKLQSVRFPGTCTILKKEQIFSRASRFLSSSSSFSSGGTQLSYQWLLFDLHVATKIFEVAYSCAMRCSFTELEPVMYCTLSS